MEKNDVGGVALLDVGGVTPAYVEVDDDEEVEELDVEGDDVGGFTPVDVEVDVDEEVEALDVEGDDVGGFTPVDVEVDGNGPSELPFAGWIECV